MAYKLQLKRGASGSLPTGSAGEPLFTTDTNDLYIGTGASNQRYQKYIASGTSSQFIKGDGSLDSNTYYLASNPSAYIALTALTASSPLSYNNTTGAFTIAQASGSVNGFLSSTDWTTFNNKQNTITNPVTGTGTTNYLSKWTSGTAIGNSLIFDNGTSVGINNTSPQSFDSGGIKALDGKGNTGFAFIAQGASTQFRLAADDSLGGVLNVIGAYPLVFFTNGSERMRLTSTGLGIGTTSPGAKLDVVGEGIFSGFLTAGNSILIKNTINAYAYQNFGANTGFGWQIGKADNSGGIAPSNGFYIYDLTNSVTRMVISQTGNMGLGVVPSAWNVGKAFEIGGLGSFIFGGGSTQNIVGTNSYYNSGWKYAAGTAAATQYEQSAGFHYWYTSPSGTAGNAISFTQAMTLTAGGNLLVGSTADSGEKLQVSGNIRTNSGYVQIRNSSNPSLYLNNNTVQWQNYIKSSYDYAISDAVRDVLTLGYNGAASYFSGCNVGIGTTSPSEKLHVVGNQKIDGVLTIATSSSTALTINSTASAAYIGMSDSSGSFVYLGSDNGSMLFQTPTSSYSTKMTLDSPGNLGLGVVPSAWGSSYKAIDISGGAAIAALSNWTYITANAYDNGTNWIYKSSSYATLSLSINGEQRWYTAPSGTAGGTISFTQAMTLDASGRLGVGTTSPQSNLQVLGTIKVATGNAQGILGLGEANGTTVNVGIWRGAANAPTTDGNFLNLGGYEGIVFATGNSAIGSQTERMRITSGGNLLVGTTTDTGDRINSAGSIRVPSATFFRYDGDTGLIGSGSSISGGTVSQLGIRAASDILFATNGANERLRITSAGSVGIGTTSPSYKLDVVGIGSFQGDSAEVLRLHKTSGGGSQLIMSTTFAGGNTYGISPFIAGVSNGGFSITDITNNVQRIVIQDSTGNVGIGTTSPTEKLDVIGGAVAAGNGTIRTGITYSSLGLVGTFTNHDLGVITNGSERLRITSGGNVGIGLTNPDAKLYVREDSGFVATFDSLGTNGAKIQLLNRGVDAFAITMPANTGHLAFLSSGTTERMRITSGGNVGIGTTSPAVTLHVIGQEQRFGGVASGLISIYNSVNRSGYIQANNVVDFRIASDTDPMTFYVNGSERLRIASTGAATFSSSVTAVDFIGNLEASNIRVNQTLSTSSSGASGNFLTINVNGTLYKLQLLNT
jgi:hypothetical protein